MEVDVGARASRPQILAQQLATVSVASPSRRGIINIFHSPELEQEQKQAGRPRSQHKGWYSRGYLPHFDSPGMLQGITFRLADSLPAHVVMALADDPELMENAEKRAWVEAHLNAGHGACYLRQTVIAKMVEKALLHFDGIRYRQIAWVVMPNHVHTLIETFEGEPLADVIQSWKSYTAKRANRMLDRKGQFWALGYFDRYIRNERHFYNALNYIHNNPVKAGLVDKAENWQFSSAWERGRLAR